MCTFILLSWLFCFCVIGYLFYTIHKKNKQVCKQFNEIKKAQEEAIYGKRLPPKRIKRIK